MTSPPDSVPSIDRSVTDRDAVSKGDTVVLTKRITEDDVISLARATGDENPLHLDENYAAETRFGGRIAHGVLAMGMLSGAMAALPGCPVILEWGATSFDAPIVIGEKYHAAAVIVEDEGNDRYIVGLEFRTGGDEASDTETIIDGHAKVLLDPEPDGTAASSD